MAVQRGGNKRAWEHALRAPTLILGVGNILLGDEGVGVRVVETLHDKDLPEGVEVLDGGTASLDLLNSLADREKVIVIDAVQGGCEPGSIYRFTPDDVETPYEHATSLHQVGLLETLAIARQLGCTPREVIILGVEPASLEYGLGLSAQVAAAVPRAIDMVLAELADEPPVGGQAEPGSTGESPGEEGGDA